MIFVKRWGFAEIEDDSKCSSVSGHNLATETSIHGYIIYSGRSKNETEFRIRITGAEDQVRVGDE